MDSNDTERLQIAREELEKTARDEQFANLPILIFANKQDIPTALSPSQLSVACNLEKILEGKTWKTFGCCALTGDGMQEGLSWISEAIHANKQMKVHQDGILEKTAKQVSVALFSLFGHKEPV